MNHDEHDPRLPRRDEPLGTPPTDVTPGTSPLTDRATQLSGANLLEIADDLMPEDEAQVLLAGRSKPTAKWRLYVRRYLRNKMAVIGLVIFVLLVLVSLFGKFLTPYHYTDVDFLAITTPPGGDHYLGTNGAGNDLFAMLVHGLQRSLVIGVVVSLSTTIISAIVGATAAYIGGSFEKVVLAIIHFLLVVPSFLILALIANDRGGDWRALIVVLILFGWMFYARIVWTLTISLREREYVSAARYMGLRPMTVVLRHIVPNIGSMLTIHFALGVVTTIMSETALSFLGFGVKPPDVSLGSLIGQGGSVLTSAPWMFWFPAMTLTLLTTSMAFIADGLRDALDPSSQSGGRA